MGIGQRIFAISAGRMHRALAISLISIFCLPFGMSLAKGMEKDPLPACCRRGGAHHCAMMAMLMGSEGTSFRGISPCPMQHAEQLGSTVAIALPLPLTAHPDLSHEKLISAASSAHDFSTSLQ